jgi:hypothetical protein
MNIAALEKCPASTCEGAANATVTEEDVKLASNLTDAAANTSAPAAKGAPAPAAKSAAVASSPFSMLAAAACLMAGLVAML